VVWGAEIAYGIALIQVFTAVVAEFINIHLLIYQDTVENAVIYFVALQVIMEVTSLYFESLIGVKIKKIMHHRPEVKLRSSAIPLASRSRFHQFARIFYKVLRTFYVSLVFYFVPFAVVWG